jgi:hypothetical protein
MEKLCSFQASVTSYLVMWCQIQKNGVLNYTVLKASKLTGNKLQNLRFPVFWAAVLSSRVTVSRCFEGILGISPATHCNNPEDLNPQQITYQAQKLSVSCTTSSAASVSFLRDVENCCSLAMYKFNQFDFRILS